jgi:hypothetical protein
MRFQDAARDGRAVVYAGIQSDPLVARLAALLADATPAQLVLARAAMNGEGSDPGTWRAMAPACFPDDRSEAILAASLDVAGHGDQVRNQLRGAVVEAVTEALLRRRASAVRRERRILFDGVRAEIHPYDVTVEEDGRAEAYDCKWSARGISADVLHQLDDARTNALAEDQRLDVALVVFDTSPACIVRLERQTAPHVATRLITIASLHSLAEPAQPGARSPAGRDA